MVVTHTLDETVNDLNEDNDTHSVSEE
jgi:hypothetical protein